MPFSIAVAIWSSGSLSLTLAILFSLMLGLAYGLNSDSARWGLTAGLVYGLFFGFLLGPLRGLLIGAAFLSGYFRVFFYLIEAPLSWALGTLATKGDAHKLWQLNPVRWDELIWFPLPGLDRHLLALETQNGRAAQAAMLQVQESFRQRWAAERVLGAVDDPDEVGKIDYVSIKIRSHMTSDFENLLMVLRHHSKVSLASFPLRQNQRFDFLNYQRQML